MARAPRIQKDFLDETLGTLKKFFLYVGLFSFATNILMLALPIYTMQVLDRVVSSHSSETLLWLSIITLALFIMLGAFSLMRSLALIKAGEWMDRKLGKRFLNLSLAQCTLKSGSSGSQNLRDLQTLKGFITGNNMVSLLDAPWSILFLFAIFLIHPVPGFIVLGGSVILIVFAVINEVAVRKAHEQVNENSVQNLISVETSARNAEVIEAMGMTSAVVSNWEENNSDTLAKQLQANNRSAVIASIAKAFRMMLQVLTMGAGTYLVLKGQMTMGGVIACSIIAGRALAPFEAAIGTWSSLSSARKSYERLKRNIKALPERNTSISLPKPKGHLEAEKVVYASLGSNKPILKGISFAVAAGEIVGVVGPSGAGKSTLAKLIMGVWKPNSGNIRLDSADVYSWNRDEFGLHVGYLPQDVELFEGTVKQNIGRLRKEISDEAVVQAAKMAHAHEFILHLSSGYDTEIGAGGSNLSAGQRQRIALARTFYGDPKLIVLDEPNSNLDDIGEAALMGAIRNAKQFGITTVIIAHRPSLLTHVDKLLVLRDGLVVDFGPAREVLTKYSKMSAEQQPQSAGQQARIAAQTKEVTAAGKPTAETNPGVWKASVTGLDDVKKPDAETDKKKGDPKK